MSIAQDVEQRTRKVAQNPAQPKRRGATTPNVGHLLSDEHARHLAASAIDPEVRAERGTFTARKGKDVPQDCGQLPSKPGLIFPVHTLDGGVFFRLRPNNPGRLPKYLQPKGHPNRLDVHPRQHERIKRPGGTRYVTEGEKKVDAGVSRDMLMVGQSGVWNGQKDKALIPDWLLLPLAGETYSILFDSDIEANESVQMAADRTASLLRERGANVFITLLPPSADGSKQGLDDFFANGGTVKQLELLTRPYDADLVERVRLTRDEKLCALVADLKRTFWKTEWKGRGGHTDRDVYLALAEASARHGKSHKDGLRVTKSWGALQVEAKVARQTLSDSLTRLEGLGKLYRDNEGREDGKTGSFVMRANLDHSERRKAQSKSDDRIGNGDEQRKVASTSLVSRASHDVPRLRWSRPGFTPKRGFVTGTRRVRESKADQPRERIERLGKVRGAVVDALVKAGGECTLEELCSVLHRKRARDVRRRTLPMLEEAGVIETEGDVIRLARDWFQRLEAAREQGGEVEADELAEVRRRQKSDAYRSRNKEQTSKPSAASKKAIDHSHEKRAENLAAHREHRSGADVAELKAKQFAKRYVHDRLRELGRIRLELLQEILRDEGGTLAYALPAARSLGCVVERLPEYGNEEFVFAPPVWSQEVVA